jgi:disulfide bond formation protein DsbB
MKQTGFRLDFIASLVVCAVILGVALYMEFAMGLDPCLLCMSQRFVFLAIAFVSLLAALHNPIFGGHKVYGGIIAMLAIGGGALAIRQLYLQGLPADQVPACGPGFDFMLEAFPFTEVLVAMITGSGSCAEVQWTLMGISIPGWSLIAYALLGLNGLRLTFSRARLLLV